MVPNIDRRIVSTIVNAIVYARGGATFNDIVAAFPTPPAKHLVRRWLRELVDAGLLDVNETVQPHLYYITPAANDYVDRPANPDQDSENPPHAACATPAPASTAPTESSLAEEIGEALAPLIDSACANPPTATDSPVRKPSFDAVINLFPEPIRPLIRSLPSARQGALYAGLAATGVALASLVRQHPWAVTGGGVAVVASVFTIVRRRRPIQAPAQTSTQSASAPSSVRTTTTASAPSSVSLLDRSTVPPFDRSADAASPTASDLSSARPSTTRSTDRPFDGPPVDRPSFDRSSVPQIDRSTVPPIDHPSDTAAQPSTQPSTLVVSRRAFGLTIAASLAVTAIVVALTWHFASVTPFDHSSDTATHPSSDRLSSRSTSTAFAPPIDRSTVPPADRSTDTPFDGSTVPQIARSSDAASHSSSGRSAAIAIAPSSVLPIDRSPVLPAGRSTDAASPTSSDRASSQSTPTAFADASVRPIDRSTDTATQTASDRSSSRSTSTAFANGSARPFDRSTVPPLDRSTVSASPASSAVQVLSASTPGAYVFKDGAWVPLPRNNAHVLQTTTPKLTALLGSFEPWDDAAADKSTAPLKKEIAELVFDGSDAVPAAPTIDLVIAYVGPLATIPFDQQARYPDLKSYPRMELAPMKTSASGARYAPLFSIAPGFTGFGPARVRDATLEQRAIPPYDGVAVHAATFLRCATPLPAGRYALSCGPGTFELLIE